MSANRPHVTVGIPFFNEERVLAEAIRSVLAQRDVDIDVILVNDGSSDQSLAIARSFEDPRIAVASDGERRRLPARLNEIVRRARGELVARMDADDVMHPDRLRRQLEVFDDDPSVDVVGCSIGLVDDAGNVFAVVDSAPQPMTAASAVETGLIAHPTMLARRRWLLKNPYDEKLTRAEDRDLWCRTVSTSSYRSIPEPLYALRVSTRDLRFLKDYLDAQKQNRTIYIRYGPTAVGLQRTAGLFLESYAKSLFMRVAVRAGIAGRLVRRRGRPPSAKDLQLIQQALEAGREPVSARNV